MDMSSKRICSSCFRFPCHHSQCFSILYLSSKFSLNSESSYDINLDVELSSPEKVISNHDLLTLILLRVPIRKLICFASVSKLWHSLITAPFFSLIRSNGNFPLRTSGLFFQINVPKHVISFVSLDNDNHTTSPFRELPFEYARDPCIPRIRIVDSCAGLLLCSSCPFVVNFRYYIYNPTTSQLLTLPKNNYSDRHYAAVLAFDPSKSPHFKVFICGAVPTPQDNQMQVDMSLPTQRQFYIYSSETRTWRPSGKPFISKMNFGYSVYCNGCVHWVLESISNSGQNSCYYFNLDEERGETMPRPPIFLMSNRQVTFYIGESQNHLHAVEVYACDNLLNVYEMQSDYSGWFLKYEVDLSPISQVFPDMMKIPEEVYVLSLVRRENFEEDSFLVLQIPGKPRKAIRYNLVDRSFKGIWDFSFPKYLTSHFPPIKFQAHQYIESLSRV